MPLVAVIAYLMPPPVPHFSPETVDVVPRYSIRMNIRPVQSLAASQGAQLVLAALTALVDVLDRQVS
jgi:hypothetical protein